MRAAVLAGGAASRFEGRPKGLERVGGERIIDRVARALETATGTPPILVANAPDAAHWVPGARVVRDALPGRGSLGGIYSAVCAGEGPVLALAWDMPFVPAALLVDLVRDADEYDVFLPESAGRRGIEPLCGVYGPACAIPIREQLEREDYRAIGFHHAVRVGTLPLSEVARHGDPASMFFNVNTADELAQAEAMWQRHG